MLTLLIKSQCLNKLWISLQFLKSCGKNQEYEMDFFHRIMGGIVAELFLKFA